MNARFAPLFASLLGLTLVCGSLLASPAPAQAIAGGRRGPDTPWQLGKLSSQGGTVENCPTEFTCHNFVIRQCPQVQIAEQGALATSYPAGTPKGVVLFFRGGSGADWWAFTALSQQWMLDVRDRDSFVMVQVRFTTGWTNAKSGVPTGPALLACRPATVAKWVHDHIYAPLHLSPLPGQCGYCITGNSGGSSAVSYSLSFYGLGRILDAVVPTGGPDHAGIAKACLREPGYEFNDGDLQTIDMSYGFLDPETDPGPCLLADPSWSLAWDADSIDLSGNDYDYPNTRIEFIEGGLDDTGAPAHGRLYYDVLAQDPNNNVLWNLVPNMPHRIADSQLGLNQLEQALLKTIH